MGRGIRDKNKVKCFNCYGYGHYATECMKPKQSKDVRLEMNMAQVEDDEPALLLAKYEKNEKNLMLVNEEKVKPSLLRSRNGERIQSNVWYLDNRASNHIMGCKLKFTELDEGVTGHVKFGDGSTVKIEGKDSITFECENGEEHVLKEVYYIPSLQ